MYSFRQLFSVSIILLRFIHNTEYIILMLFFFFFLLCGTPLYEYVTIKKICHNFFTHLSVDGHLNYFQFLDSIGKASVNNCMNMCLHYNIYTYMYCHYASLMDSTDFQKHNIPVLYVTNLTGFIQYHLIFNPYLNFLGCLKDSFFFNGGSVQINIEFDYVS